MFAILLAIPAAILFYGIRVYVFDKRYRLPPGPRPYPFIGNLTVFNQTTAMWATLRDLSKQYGPVFTLYFGQMRAVILNDAKVIHDTLVGQGDIFSGRIDSKVPGFDHLAESLVTANNDVWRKRRRFTVRAMRDFGMGKDAMVTNIQDEVVHLLPELESYKCKPFNPKLLLNNAISNIICSFVFGKRFHYDDDALHEILMKLEAILLMMPEDSAKYLLVPALKYLSKPVQSKSILAFRETIKQMVTEAISEHRKDYHPENIRDFPDLFIKYENQEEGMDLESFCLVMNDMFVAGTETTATALSWTLLYLTSYPEIQARCHDAIDNAIDTLRLPSLKDRPNLVYIDAVMCEVLRHASFVPTSLSHSNLNKTAKISGYDIPPYTMIVYNVTALHRDPNYWKDPDVFRPERWISPDGKMLNHSSHFMPFGTGPRVCLGEALARVEYFIFIVSMLHRFRFVLKAPVDLNEVKQSVVRSPPDFEIIAYAR